jgi:hypothetical protein
LTSFENVNVLRSGNIEEINRFIQANDVIIFNCADGIAYSMSNLPLEPTKKYILCIQGYELYEPLERLNWAKFDYICIPSSAMKKYLLWRALEQKFNGFNQSKVVLTNYIYDKIENGKGIGIYNLSDSSDIHFVIQQIYKYMDNNPIFNINIFGNIKYKSCYKYFIDKTNVNIIYNTHSNPIDWLQSVKTIIFPNYGIGDLLTYDLCKESGFDCMASDEMIKIHNAYDQRGYKLLGDLISENIRN